MLYSSKIQFINIGFNELTRVKQILFSTNIEIKIQECFFENIDSNLIQLFSPDLLIIASGIDNETYKEAIVKFSQYIHTNDIPILLIENKKNITHLENAYKLGIWDYIVYPMDEIELKARLSSAVSINNKFKQKIKHKELLAHKTNELSIKNNELESLSKVTNKLNHSIIIIDANNKIEWISDGLNKLYEFDLFNISEELFVKIKKVNSLFDKYYKTCIETKKAQNYQSFFKLRKKKYVQTTLYPITYGEDINTVICIESDISLLKEKEESLETSREEFLYMIEDMDRISVNLENQKKEFEKQKNELEKEKKKSDELLYNILPVSIAEELKQFNRVEPKYYANVTVMFADFQSFTKSCENLKFYELVKQLNTYFIRFDEIIEKYRIEKIKTIGDAYMCAGGLPTEDKTNPIEMILASIEIQKFVSELNDKNQSKKMPFWNLRLGIHTGPVYAGVVGKTKIAYDIWGDTVNVASRMESGGEIGKVNISEATYQQIKDYFVCNYRGEIEAKNKGKVKMYFVQQIKQEYAEDQRGLIPNRKFLKLINSF